MQKRIGVIMIALLCGLVMLGPTVVSAQKITANVASTFPPDSPQDKGLNKFKQLVAERAGGRYLEGDPETIVRNLTEMEAAFCEVVLPAADLGTDPLDIEIRPKDPGLRLLYAHRLLPARGFGSLAAEDKMRLAIDAAHDGEASRLALRLRQAEVLAKTEAGGRILYRIRLPEAFMDTPLEVYRVWLPRGNRPPGLDVERVRPAGGELSFAVAKKAGYRARVVIIEPRRSAGLIVP